MSQYRLSQCKHEEVAHLTSEGPGACDWHSPYQSRIVPRTLPREHDISDRLLRRISATWMSRQRLHAIQDRYVMMNEACCSNQCLHNCASRIQLLDGAESVPTKRRSSAWSMPASFPFYHALPPNATAKMRARNRNECTLTITDDSKATAARGDLEDAQSVSLNEIRPAR